MDYGHQYADKKISAVDRELKKTYRTAQKQLKEKLADFEKQFARKNKEKKKKLDAGEITQDEYRDWMTGQVFVRSRWQEQQRMINAVLLDHNRQAMNIVQNSTFDVFAENYNYNAYLAEMKMVGTFNLYNAEAVARLILGDPKLLPEWDIDKKKDYTWNQQKVNNILRQSIIQGKGIDEITQDLADGLATKNYNRMRLFARTAITEAENAGRQQQMNDAAAMGIEVKKMWIATHDNRTRDAHRGLDGDIVPYDQPFHSALGDIQRPGDPDADPANVYNCRCTMQTIYPKYDQGTTREETIDGQSYEEWKHGKIQKQTEEEMMREYEQVWGDIAFDEISLAEFERKLSSEQKAQLEKLLSNNEHNYSKDVYWNYLSNGLGIDKAVNNFLLNLGKKQEPEEEKYITPQISKNVSSIYKDSHVGIDKATTNEQVQNVLADSGVLSSKGKVKLDKIDISNAKEIAHTMLEMNEAYPWMKKKISYVNTAKLDSNTNAEFTRKLKFANGGAKPITNITFNTLQYKNREEAKVVSSAGMYHPIGTGTVASTVRHEFGHGMVHAIAQKEGITETAKLEDEIVASVFKKLGKAQTTQNVTYMLSGYAAVSNGELIAEAIAEYHSSNTPRELAKLIRDEVVSRAKGAGLK